MWIWISAPLKPEKKSIAWKGWSLSVVRTYLSGLLFRRPRNPLYPSPLAGLRKECLFKPRGNFMSRLEDTLPSRFFPLSRAIQKLSRNRGMSGLRKGGHRTGRQISRDTRLALWLPTLSLASTRFGVEAEFSIIIRDLYNGTSLDPICQKIL